MLHHFFKGLLRVVVLLLLLCTAVGAYIGNTAYHEFREAPWDEILGIKNNTKQQLTYIRTLEKGTRLGTGPC